MLLSNACHLFSYVILYGLWNWKKLYEFRLHWIKAIRPHRENSPTRICHQKKEGLFLDENYKKRSQKQKIVVIPLYGWLTTLEVKNIGM